MRYKDNKILVEFAGISGVGKTKLANEVMNRLKNENVKFNDITSGGRKHRLHFRKIPTLLRVFFITLLVKPVSIKSAIKLFKHIGGRELALLRGKHEDGIQIFDEGIFKIAFFAVNRFSKFKHPVDFLNICFRYMRKPDILIYLKANPVVIIERRKIRNNPHENYDFSSIKKTH